MKHSGKWVTVAAVVAAFSMGGNQRAEACGDSISHYIDPEVMAVSAAEIQLERGDHEKVLATLSNVFPDLKTRKWNAKPSSDRAIRVAARALVRTDGSTKVAPFKVTGESDGSANLAWAVTKLRERHAKDPHDPSASTDLGEALSHLPESRAEAKQILSSLESRDLLVSAHGYAALARLRAAQPDAPAWLAAPLAQVEHGLTKIEGAKCSTMTTAAGVCGAEVDAARPVKVDKKVSMAAPKAPPKAPGFVKKVSYDPFL